MPIRRRHIALLALCAAAPGRACPSLRVGVLAFPGLNQRDASGRMSGLDPEIAAELSRRSGCTLQVEESNASRLWPMLSRGELPLTANLGYLPERKALVDYLLLFRLRGYVQLHRDQAARTPTRAAFDATPKLRLGIVRKALRPDSVQAWVDALAAQGRVSESVDTTSLQRAYDAGRVDAMLVFAGSMRKQPASWQARQALLPWFPDYWQTFGWAASREAVAPEWRMRLREAAESARKDGTLQRLAAPYWGGSAAEPQFEVLPAPIG